MAKPPGDINQFDSLIKEHSRIINKVSYFYASDKIPFDDLRQEIYINIWQGLPLFKGSCRISTWIYRVAVNSALMAVRSQRSQPDTVPFDFGALDLTTELDDDRIENLRTLYSLIGRLDELDKAIILLWLDEYSYDEIADTIGLKRNTIAVRLHRIKEKLSNSI